MNPNCRLPLLYLLGGLELAGTLAAFGSPPLWVGTIPGQTSLCVKGAGAPDHELDDQDLLPLYRAGKEARLQAVGYPFVRSLERPQGERQEWTICAPIAGAPAPGAGGMVELAEATAAAFRFCAGEPHDVARKCADDLLAALKALGVKPPAIPRCVPVPPVDEATLADTVRRLVADTAALRLDAPAPLAGVVQEATALDRQLQGHGAARPLYTGDGFRPVAGGAVSQQGVAVFVALTSVEAEALSKVLSLPHDLPATGGEHR